MLLPMTGGPQAVGFDEFFRMAEPRLKTALCVAFGVEIGVEATADALSYGWEKWGRVSQMGNPVGYLYRVGRDRARRTKAGRSRSVPLFDGITPQGSDWFEPGLPAALARLTERQRAAVVLVHGLGWTMAEVAGMLGVAVPTVQKHAERGLTHLRREMGVRP